MRLPAQVGSAGVLDGEDMVIDLLRDEDEIRVVWAADEPIENVSTEQTAEIRCAARRRCEFG